MLGPPLPMPRPASPRPALSLFASPLHLSSHISAQQTITATPTRPRTQPHSGATVQPKKRRSSHRPAGVTSGGPGKRYRHQGQEAHHASRARCVLQTVGSRVIPAVGPDVCRGEGPDPIRAASTRPLSMAFALAFIYLPTEPGIRISVRC